jgi:hypothetical protein
MTLSLRNLPPDVEEAILDLSRREGLSLNKATARLLEAAVRPPARNTDFDEFAGSWSAQQAEAFDSALADMRQVNPEDWG